MGTLFSYRHPESVTLKFHRSKREAKAAVNRGRDGARETRQKDLETRKSTQELPAADSNEDDAVQDSDEEGPTGGFSEEDETGSSIEGSEEEDEAMYDVEEDDLDADLDEDISSGSETDAELPVREDSEKESRKPAREQTKTIASSIRKPSVEKTAAEESNPDKLDPSLFFASFSKDRQRPSKPSSVGTKINFSTLDEEEASFRRQEAERERRRKIKRKGGVVKGRDGQPMRRLKDGRTVVRASAPSTANGEEVGADLLGEERLAPHRPLDSFEAQPSKGVRNFKERKLGFYNKSHPSQATSEQPRKKQKFNDDNGDLDAFMLGGISSSRLTGKRERSDKGSKPKRQGDSGKNRRPAPTFGFARS